MGLKVTNDQIDIKKIRLRHLYQFARDTLKDPMYQEIAPISLLRAKSQALNPQGEPNDIALLVAIHQNRCVGYHGLLPGFLQNGGRLSKILWLITFYVDTRCRGKGIGKRLVAAIQEEGVDLTTTGITKGAEMVYRSAGFGQLGDLPF